MKNQIQHTCHISNHTILIDGQVIYRASSENDLSVFLTELYRYLKIDYAKFFKMDTLSKLAFLATELLVGQINQDHYDKNEIGIVLGNRSSSILSDFIHQKSIQNPVEHFPSPAVFVYTLPNIMMGEICIRHGFSNENTLFISNKFDTDLLEKYTNYLLNELIVKECICGWIDAHADNYEAFFYFVSSRNCQSMGEHCSENIQNLRTINYQQKPKNLQETESLLI